MSGDFYIYFYTGQKGRFGHEFFRFEINQDGLLKYANNSNYRRDKIIRKSLFLSPLLIQEIKRIIEDSEITKEDYKKWPQPQEGLGKLQLEIKISGQHIDLETQKLSTLSDIQQSKDPEGLQVLYYLIQDLKCLVLSLASLHFKIKPIA